MVSCKRGLVSEGICSEISFPSLWKECMKYSSCGIRREGVLRGLTSCMVVFLPQRRETNFRTDPC